MCCYISLWSHSTAENRDLNKLKPTIPDNASILNPPFLSRFFENKIVKENNNTFLITIHYLLLKLYLIVHSNKSDYPSPKNALCQVRLKLTQWFCRKNVKGVRTNIQTAR